MNKYEAIKILNLTGDINQEVIKKAYKRACMKYHPDRNPAGLEMMKLINIAYDLLCKEPDFNAENKTVNYDETLNDAINAALTMQGVVIEICGIWIWLSGDTRTNKEQIKEAGYKWASKKKQWYFRPDDYKSSSRGKYSLDDIRAKYGSKIIDKEDQKRINK